MLKISILCSDENHPVNSYIYNWKHKVYGRYDVDIFRTKAELDGGDFLFLISCSEIISKKDRDKFRSTFVLHASDLPLGRGWSPHIWDIISGKDFLTLTLLEAEDHVDSGRIWIKRIIEVDKTCLWDEINHKLFSEEVNLINEVIDNYSNIDPYIQDRNVSPTYYRKRNILDSKVDENKSIADQFDLIRVCDPNRYPAWFELNGCRYKLIVEKIDNE